MKKRKWFSLIDKVWKYENLSSATALVASNAGAAGVDRQSVQGFLADKDLHLREIKRLLQEKRYEPYAVRAVEIPKSNGKTRMLGIPCVRDRVVQQSLRIVMEPIFEQKFKDCSFGFRPNRDCHKAIAKVEEYIRAGNVWVVEVDIENFFDSINHVMLIDEVAEEISDGSVLKLIRAFLTSGVLKDGCLLEKTQGTPQGGVISPLLANIFLHPFDEDLTRQGFNLVRYADDAVVLCQTEQEADMAMSAVLASLAKLNLKANLSKTKKVRLTIDDGIEFLGFLITEKYKFPRVNAVSSFKDKVRCRTRRTAPVSLKELIMNVNPVLRGWGNYFKVGNSYKSFEKLDSWVRMRLRCFVEKRKSRMANYCLTNKLFESNGLVSLLDLWKELHSL